ncbi:threonine-phosphate decarboxylase CobD [Denitratisoma sp. agr-D3]
MIEHGGRLRQAAQQWGIAVDQWLDLSTGIAPWPYPAPPIPAECWQRLPEDDDGLLDAARAYYGAPQLLPLAGSQAAILALPRLRPTSRVAVLDPAYGEYAPAWRAAGHDVSAFAANALAQASAEADVVMLANPNNPDGIRFHGADLLAVAARLRQRDGWLIVDEAFADADPARSLATVAGSEAAPNLIVLRSLGKFFGLAGARVGFAIAHPDLLQALGDAVGPWTLAQPSRLVARAALSDRDWQAAQRQRLATAGQRLTELLRQAGFDRPHGPDLFKTVRHPEAEALYAHCARQGVLLRCFPQWNALRFGLPADEGEWGRLQAVLAGWSGKR